MPWRSKTCAYLVVPFALAPDGLWARQTETVCFDQELAIDIAESESQHSPGVGVYALGDDGRCLTCSPIAWYGAIKPPADAAPGTPLALTSSIRLDHLADAERFSHQLH